MQLRCITDGFVSQSPIPHDIFYPRVTGHLATDLWKKCFFSQAPFKNQPASILAALGPSAARSHPSERRGSADERSGARGRLPRRRSVRPRSTSWRCLGARKKGSMIGCEGRPPWHHLKLGVSHRVAAWLLDPRKARAKSQGSTKSERFEGQVGARR